MSKQFKDVGLSTEEGVAKVAHVVDVAEVATVRHLDEQRITRTPPQNGGSRPPQAFESPTFARDIGSALRQARRARKLRVRHLSDARYPAKRLRAAERGELELSRPIVTELASRYGVDLGSLFPRRDPVAIHSGLLSMGSVAQPFEEHSLTSVLQAYLAVIDRVRTNPSTKSRPLRRDDIVVLAEYLDLPCTIVISRLADILEARGAETRAMVDLYLTGASVVGFSSAMTRGESDDLNREIVLP